MTATAAVPTKSASIQNRYEFVLLFDVEQGNPNGDPDAGNMPRIDPETGHGIVTDVCLKRKIRNFVFITKRKGDGEAEPGYEIYVKDRGVLNEQHQRAYEARNIDLGEAVSAPIPEALRAKLGDLDQLPEGFAFEEDEGKLSLVCNEKPDKNALKEVEVAIKDAYGPEVAKIAKDLTKKSKSRKPTREEVSDTRAWMCEHFFDVRAFGAVMSTGVNCGQVRGPLQIAFARSIDPIVALEHSITRVAITRTEDAAKKETEMGRKNTVPYAMYRAHGFVSPHFADATGFSDADLRLVLEALEYMFEHDRSAARGQMATRGLFIFKHDSKLGNAHAHELFERVTVQRKDPSKPARSFSDYAVTIDGAQMPKGVTFDKMVDPTRRN